MRPANILTAIADILAGIAISGYWFRADMYCLDARLRIACLCLATIGLYGGGVMFNDIMDAKLDKIERPERPIPSGVITVGQAIILASYLLLVGILAAFTVGSTAGYIAIATAVSALVYNRWGKHNQVLGPFNMGLCRGLNLLLGVSIWEPALLQYWWIGLLPVVYIAAVTAISRGEVYGGNKRVLRIAAVGYAVVYTSIAILAALNGRIWQALPFILLFAFMINKPLANAMKDPSGPNIGKAVKGGIIALIAMNAAWGAAFVSIPFALCVLLLLPLSLWLAKVFAVT
ncbi:MULTISPECIES: UbiA-like protein EboC [Chitinophaga]|uniref:UbiA-like protein EboC n=1 Tax=Chitinophaga TaxID=79328 RepID=UPI000BB08451|nr:MULTISPECIES: UbiA-like protein EboC [Chitinophaga]ASZ09773.1 polyprenyltransferase [Chitinophaga sp. MD30]